MLSFPFRVKYASASGLHAGVQTESAPLFREVDAAAIVRLVLR